MTKYDQLRLELRGLAARVTALESGRSARRKRETISLPALTRPADAAKVRETQRLWSEYQTVAAEVYEPRSERGSKSRFAERHHLSEREFRRAFSLTDKRGLGAVPRARYNDVIREVTETLRKTLNESPGTRRESPTMRLKRAV
jgi:hypothetical protein